MRLACCFKRFPKRIGVPILSRSTCRSVHARVRPAVGAIAQRQALVAEDGMELRPDLILLAPGDAHLTLEPQMARS